jgi:hypothetical protein
MPPSRTPLGSISGNRFKGTHISPYIRGKIAGKASKGCSQRRIAIQLKLTKLIVQYTIIQDELRNKGVSLLRTARRKSYNDYDKRILLQYIRLNPKDIYEQVITACGLRYRPTTVKTILRKYGISNWRVKRRPELIEAYTTARLAWCLAYRGWTAEEWGLVVWSDEYSMERGRGKRGEWVFYTPE